MKALVKSNFIQSNKHHYEKTKLAIAALIIATSSLTMLSCGSDESTNTDTTTTTDTTTITTETTTTTIDNNTAIPIDSNAATAPGVDAEDTNDGRGTQNVPVRR